MPDAATPLEDRVHRPWHEGTAVVPAFPRVASRRVDCLEQLDVDVDRVDEIISREMK